MIELIYAEAASQDYNKCSTQNGKSQVMVKLDVWDTYNWWISAEVCIIRGKQIKVILSIKVDKPFMFSGLEAAK